MNRFKFRVWDKEEKRMDYISLDQMISDLGNNMPKRNSLKVMSEWEPHEKFYPKIWMQSTGLKDKNGKEIFEGDIVTTTDFDELIKGTMTWNNKAANYEIMNDEDFKRTFEMEGDEYEVVGNLYENHNLLTNNNE